MRIVVVGLGFGSAFVPIYLKHPDVTRVGVCELNADLLNKTCGEHGIEDRFTHLDQVLADDRWDAVHLLTPVPLHVEQTLAVLTSGKHCACAVPAATSIEDLRRIVAAERASGKNYMMMETAVYDRQFFYAERLVQSGGLGNITFLRGLYTQDLEGSYPAYWRAQPPMHYATHVMGPILALARTRASSVSCLGSGRLRDDIQQTGGNVFPLQIGIFRLAGSNLAAEVTRSWFQTARPYTEAFSVYGDKKGFEWQQVEDEEPMLYTIEPLVEGWRGRHVAGERVKVPFRPDLLPPAIQEFADGGHGGSHPHLVHEFVRSCVEGRRSAIHSSVAADWCAPGICANESSLQEGKTVEIPAFE
ncbi:MAG TPA: Gfo/Idh/MocA family oxidoreductase [Fimbriimonas sp.]|nr:Gfo/Idh/MocA family oxidoreductase [Fimbriimonas sp.]